MKQFKAEMAGETKQNKEEDTEKREHKVKNKQSQRQRPLYRRGVLGVRRLEQVGPSGTGQARPQIPPDAGSTRVQS